MHLYSHADIWSMTRIGNAELKRLQQDFIDNLTAKSKNQTNFDYCSFLSGSKT
jgi:hypothetical protein